MKQPFEFFRISISKLIFRVTFWIYGCVRNKQVKYSGTRTILLNLCTKYSFFPDFHKNVCVSFYELNSESHNIMLCNAALVITV